VTLHETRYGKTSNEETYIVGPDAFSTSQCLHFDNAARYITDLEVRYDVTQSFQGALGTQNLFDVRPNTRPYEAQLEGWPLRRRKRDRVQRRFLLSARALRVLTALHLHSRNGWNGRARLCP
jgi:hypothetical protein